MLEDVRSDSSFWRDGRFECFLMLAMFRNPLFPSVVSLSRSIGVIFELTLFFTNIIQTQLRQTQLHKGDSLFVVKGMLMALLVTTGVSDDVAQESLMPVGLQALEGPAEPMPCRPATLEDPLPDQIVLDQHSSTQFHKSVLVQSVRRVPRT